MGEGVGVGDGVGEGVGVGDGVGEGVGESVGVGVGPTQLTPLFQTRELFLETQKYFFPASILVIPRVGHEVPGIAALFAN